MPRTPRLGQIIPVRLGDDEYPGEVVDVTEDAITLAIRVEHDPRSVLPATGSVTWKGGRGQDFGHAEMNCLTTVTVRLPRPKAKPPRLERRIAVDVWEAPGSQDLIASGFTRNLTGERAELELNRTLPTDAPIEVTLYLGKDALRIPARAEAAPADGNQVSILFEPTAAARTQLTRYIFSQIRRGTP